MYWRNIKGKSIVVERFMRILKDKINKGMAAIDSKTYVGYLNKLVDEYNITLLVNKYRRI